MTVTILFLGPLADLAGEPSRTVTGPLNWDGLLAEVGPRLSKELAGERVNVACAGKVLSDKTALNAQDGDEIALLPPVSGG
jgi:molybdopterin synthase sulfur carrier subunit